MARRLPSPFATDVPHTAAYHGIEYREPRTYSDARSAGLSSDDGDAGGRVKLGFVLTKENVVVAVSPGSLSHIAGFVPGDVIMAVDGVGRAAI